ncbi:MarR family winged helix-turn-helix transcriptional regulator [Colwellia psychrerythraea]|uniref:Regulatory protein MarR n=1 Tax=Colwellia psychrerythraea TaxID=28229 RepID=A0A099L543_COLPS|nr:MarR family transcriptional regulator [Colwellia psychrerythraea]KGJ97540.1 regulatory protein MarR [Colwellia psychrerythraea]
MHTNIAISFLKTAQWLNSEVSRQLEPLDLTAQQLKVLSIVALSENKQATVNEIKAQMFDPMSNVSRLLNKLMGKQLIIKVRNQEDQRLVHIKITKLGIESMCAGKKLMDQGLSAVGKLQDDELELLAKLISKIRS